LLANPPGSTTEPSAPPRAGQLVAPTVGTSIQNLIRSARSPGGVQMNTEELAD
jgi:hypothetical protein